MKRMLSVVVCGVVLALAGCPSNTPTGTNGAGTNGTGGPVEIEDGGLADLTGTVKVDGSSTVYPITEAVADAFKKTYPKVNVTVGVSGTGGGFKRFVKGETDISDASRPIKDKEFAQARESGVAFVELPVAYDGLTIVVNPKNDWVQQLTIDQIRRIFLADGAKTWSDLDPSWPAKPIRIYSPGTDSGTFDYFKEVVAGEKGSLRSDMSVSEDDNILVRAVETEDIAIAFFGVAYYMENKDKLKAIPIINPETNEPVSPTPEAIEKGTYAPFGRPLFIYVAEASLKRPEIKEFVSFYLEQAGALSKKVGYVPLPEDLSKRAVEHFEGRLIGTHYLSEAGEKRTGPLATVYVPENLVK